MPTDDDKPATPINPISDAEKARMTEMRKALKSVIVTDGISSAEAKIIADCYFETISSCGGVSAIEADGQFWRVKAAIGYGGVPVKHFQINKVTGAVTSSIGPTYENPLDIIR